MDQEEADRIVREQERLEREQRTASFYRRANYSRQHILEGLRYGRISLKDAYTFAEEAGCILDGRPDPALFNPLEKTHWTIPMVLTWIMTRDADLTRRQDDEYLAECSMFRPIPDKEGVEGPHMGFVLETFGSATTVRLQIMTDPAEFTAAERDMRRKLGAGKIVATGRRLADRADGQEIPRDSWPALVISEHRDADVLRYRDNAGYSWSHVLIRADGVLKCWPERSRSAPPRSEPESCVDFLAAIMKKSPGKRTHTNPVLWQLWNEHKRQTHRGHGSGTYGVGPVPAPCDSATRARPSRSFQERLRKAQEVAGAQAWSRGGGHGGQPRKRKPHGTAKET